MNIQLTLNDIIPTEQSSEPNIQTPYTNGMLGCCSLYRECSIQGECLHKDNDYYLNCAYRKNLENGNVFYSSTSPNFDSTFFEALCKSYESLDDKESFWQLVDYFVRKKRMALSLFCLYNDRVKHILDATKNLDIFNLSYDISKYTNCALISELRKIITNVGLDTEKTIKKNRKDSITDAFGKYDILSDALFQKYMFITINSSKQIYLDEFFRKYYNNNNVKTALSDIRRAPSEY